MIEKTFEALFRHAILIILPIFVIPLDAMAYVLSTPPQYEASAGVWVERATYLSYTTDDLNRYRTSSACVRDESEDLSLAAEHDSV